MKSTLLRSSISVKRLRSPSRWLDLGIVLIVLLSMPIILGVVFLAFRANYSYIAGISEARVAYPIKTSLSSTDQVNVHACFARHKKAISWEGLDLSDIFSFQDQPRHKAGYETFTDCYAPWIVIP